MEVPMTTYINWKHPLKNRVEQSLTWSELDPEKRFSRSEKESPLKEWWLKQQELKRKDRERDKQMLQGKNED
jgi:hypothetical protein